MDIKDIDLASLGLTQNNTTGNSREAEAEDTFMTLMMTQLQNQDPFQPMEGGEFLTQLAQFEMVAGVNAMQAGLESLASSMLSNQVLESAALVGKTVFAETSQAQLGEGATIEGAVDVPPGTTAVRLNIVSAGGELVRQLEVPALAGRQNFLWDGLDASGNPVASGNYRITAELDHADGQSAGRVLLADQVRSVTLGGRGEPPLLNLAGGGQLAFGSVLEIR